MESKILNGSKLITDEFIIDKWTTNIEIQARIRGGNGDILTDYSVADQIHTFDIISYNCRGNRNGSLETELRSLVDNHNPDIMHLTEYRMNEKKDIRLLGYSQYKFRFTHEVDRQCVYIKTGINNISQINSNSNFCHNVKIDGHVFSFLYVPPRMMHSLSIIHSELTNAFTLKSIIIGDANMHMPSIQNGSNGIGRGFEALISDHSYSCRNTPFISTMKRGININDIVIAHQSKIGSVGPVIVLTDDCTNSDHFPIKFQYFLDTPISILRSIRWSKLRNDPYALNALRLKLETDFKSKSHAFEAFSINRKWDYILKTCIKHAKIALGTCNILDRNQMKDCDEIIQILAIRKQKLKRKLRKRNITRNRQIIIKQQINSINKEIKRQRSKEKKEEFEKYLENVNEDQTSAFIELCKLRNSKRHNKTFDCDLETIIEHQRHHFSKKIHLRIYLQIIIDFIP
eukprot:NODE_421_length_7712_cov_1.035597.p2 type:complete len:458 gc:universal NODE_421_length_7712_cov_1.035597:3689-2316(-)